MRYTSNADLTQIARTLRKNMTKEEKKLWYDCLRYLPCAFHRQYVVGHYIVDFCCHAAMLIIELDGAQHYEDAALQYDKERDEYLRNLGYTVLRYTNIELNSKFKDVCEDIWNHLPTSVTA